MRSLPARLSSGLPKSAYLLSAATAVMLAACSSTSQRFADNPSNADPVYTASVPKDQEASAEDNTVSARPLATAPIKHRRPSYASNGYNYQAYKQPAYRPSLDRQPAGEPPPPAPVQTAQARTGTTGPAVASAQVRVGPGMTLYSIARVNGLTVGELARANGISPPYGVQTGQLVRIPGVARAQAPEPPRAPAKMVAVGPQEKPIPVAGATHAVSAGETLFSLGRAYGVGPYAIADLNRLPHDASLSVGQTLRIPAGSTQAAALKQTPPSARTAAEITPAAPVKAAQAEPAPPTVKAAKPEVAATSAPQTQPKAQATQAEQAAPPPDPGLPGFRWPVKGKVISSYGAKPNGLRNEGINIAVPEGTSIRAAESGVVAYAGNELKGYGNLVLIRHESGWVTAYAHAKELFVKRGDTVRRGDVIAKAGQTGSVASPQLHFEVRKGATAMDPLRFLGSATASN